MAKPGSRGFRGPPGRTDARASGDPVHRLEHGGRSRRYLVHRPVAAGDAPLPLVLAFHGGLGRAEVQRTQSGLDEVADREGFCVVYPDGTGRTGRHLTWNAGTCCGYAVAHGVDDVGFVDALLDDVARRYPVDPRRVYACGMSNGAMLCYRLACELSHRLAAIGPVAGSMGVDGPEPSRPVPVVHFHGLEDENSRFQGGRGRNQIQPLPHRAIPEVIEWWRTVNGCEPQPEITRDGECVVHRYRPAAGAPGAPVVLYALTRGGHTWPGGQDVTRHLDTGRLVESVDASSLLWEFFREFTL